MNQTVQRKTLADGRVVERREARDRGTGATYFEYRQVSERDLAMEALPPDASLFYGRRDYAGAQFAGKARDAAIHKIATMGTESLVNFTEPPSEQFERYRRACGSSSIVDLVERTALDDELISLARSGSPELAKLLDALRAKPELATDPEALFGVGNAVRVSPLVVRLYGLSREAVLNLLTRHRRGDFGTVGDYAEPDEASERFLFAPYFGPLAANCAAVFRANGIVQSRFPIEVKNRAMTRAEGDLVVVTTLLATETGREPQTTITSSRDIH